MLSTRSSLIQTLPKLLRRNHLEGARKLVETAHEADIALLFRQLPITQQQKLFELLATPERQAEVLVEVDPGIARDFLEPVADAAILTLLRHMSDDDAADILELLPEERAEQLIKALRKTGDNDVIELFDYDSETAAGLMTTEFFALPETTSCEDALKALQGHGDEFEISYYLFVINEAGHLVGVVSLRELVLSPSTEILRSIMETEVVRVTVDMDQEDVARMVARYNLLAIPVVDSTNKLVGVVTVDDIIDVIRLEATEDMLKMAGVSDNIDQRSPLSAARARIPWLLASFVGGVLAAVLIGAYEASIAKVVPLAAFIPIVLGMGGNVGIQSATIVTRGLATGRIDTQQLTRVLSTELIVSLISGLVYGVLLGSVAWIAYYDSVLVKSGLLFGATVGLSVAAAMVIAATIGGLVPMLFARVNIDPALASGPFVTTAVDVFGILSYFSIAVVLLNI